MLFFPYISKNVSAKYYKENKEILQKESVTKLSQKMKNKSFLSIEKKIIERAKMPNHNYIKLLFQKIIT